MQTITLEPWDAVVVDATDSHDEILANKTIMSESGKAVLRNNIIADSYRQPSLRPLRLNGGENLGATRPMTSRRPSRTYLRLSGKSLLTWATRSM